MSSPALGSAQRKLLLVEGNDDLRFFKALLGHLEITDIKVDKYNGKANPRTDLSERIRSPEFRLATSLGIVRDADESSHSAFDSVIGALRRANLPTPDASAIPTEENGLLVSVLILPPSDSQGELEDVCLSSIESTPEMQCVDDYFKCLSSIEPSISANHIAKARLHSYLAIGPARITDGGNITRRQPALRLGEAAEAGVWDWTSPVFREMLDFLKNL